MNEYKRRRRIQQAARGGYYSGCIKTLETTKESRMATLSIIHDDETENEFEIDLCCESCAAELYGWSNEQYQLVHSRVEHNQPLRVSGSIDTEQQLISYVATLCKSATRPEAWQPQL